MSYSLDQTIKISERCPVCDVPNIGAPDGLQATQALFEFARALKAAVTVLRDKRLSCGSLSLEFIEP